MSHFAKVARVPGDPILGLLDAYRNDPRADKLDLGVGVYKDAQGLTPILRSVKLAEQRLVEQETTKSYVGGHGDALFAARLAELALGAASPLLLEQRADATQTPGGTGALRLAGDFIAHCLPGRGIWLSDPTWPIHETAVRRRRPEGFPLPLRQRRQPPGCRGDACWPGAHSPGRRGAAACLLPQPDRFRPEPRRLAQGARRGASAASCCR
ncbi:aromatic amino acid aminotransferase [Pseudomonas aeruginosa]|nr:aromatic amino acid aminotransferase [Pseudomonas aeruginosa]